MVYKQTAYYSLSELVLAILVMKQAPELLAL